MATEYNELDQIGTRRPEAEQRDRFVQTRPNETEVIGTRSTYNPIFDTSDTPIVDNPVEAFMAGLQSGIKNVSAQNINMNAAFKTFMGKDEEAQALLEKANVFEYEASLPLMNMEQFDEFLEEPTFIGFMNQMAGATGQFVPSAVATLVEAGALAAAGVGLTVATGGTAPAALIGSGSAGAAALRQVPKGIARRGSHSKTKDYLNNIIKKQYQNSLDVKAKRRPTKPLTPRELADLENYIYPALRAEKLARNGKRGALIGAFGQEFRQGSGIAFSDYADQDMKGREEAMQSFAQGGVFGLIGVGSEYLVASQVLKRFKKTPLTRKSLEDDLFKYDKPKSQMLKDFGSIAGVTAFSEGIAEGLQEELSVQQKFSIDDAYTKANANLDRAHAYFAGFFGGLGLGGGIGGVTAVTNKARQFLHTTADNEFARRQAESRARVVASETGVIQEAAGAIQDQFGFAFDTKSTKDSVWVDLGTRTQFEKVQEMLFKKYGDKIIAVPSFGRGALFTTNPLKAEQYQAFLDTNRDDDAMHDDLLSKILGYTKPRDNSDGWVVYIRDMQTGNQVWYQQTDATPDENNVTGVMVAKDQAYKILGKANLGQKGRYKVDVQTREEHIQERLDAIPESEREVAFFDEETKQPSTKKQNIDETPTEEPAPDVDPKVIEAAQRKVGKSKGVNRSVNDTTALNPIIKNFGIDGAIAYINAAYDQANANVNADTELTPERAQSIIEGNETQRQKDIKDLEGQRPDPKDRDAFMDMDEGLDGTSEPTEEGEQGIDAEIEAIIDELKEATPESIEGINQQLQLYGMDLTYQQVKVAQSILNSIGSSRGRVYRETGKFETKQETRRRTNYTDAQLEEGRQFLLQRKMFPSKKQIAEGAFKSTQKEYKEAVKNLKPFNELSETEKNKIANELNNIKAFELPANLQLGREVVSEKQVPIKEVVDLGKKTIKDLSKDQKQRLLYFIQELDKGISSLEAQIDTKPQDAEILEALKLLRSDLLQYINPFVSYLESGLEEKISELGDSVLSEVENITPLTSSEAELTPKSTPIDKANVKDAIKGEKIFKNDDPVIMQRGGNGTIQNPYTDPSQLSKKETTIENSAFYIRKGDEKANEGLIREARSLIHVNFRREFDAASDKFSTNLLKRFIEKTKKDRRTIIKQKEELESYPELLNQQKQVEQDFDKLRNDIGKDIKEGATQNAERYKELTERKADIARKIELSLQEVENVTEFLRIVPLAELGKLRKAIGVVQELDMQSDEKFVLVMHEVDNAQPLIRQSKNSITNIEEYINDIVAYGIEAGENKNEKKQVKFRIKSAYNHKRNSKSKGQNADIGVMASRMVTLMRYTQRRDQAIDQIGDKNFEQLRALGFVDLIDALNSYGHVLEYYPEGVKDINTMKNKKEFGPGITLTNNFIPGSNAKTVKAILRDLQNLQTKQDKGANTEIEQDLTDMFGEKAMSIVLGDKRTKARARATVRQSTPVTKIISGGQSGADILFSKVGKEAGLATGGLMPPKFKTEDGNRPNYKKEYNMEEDTTEGYKSRTTKNVQNSDGTIVLVKNKKYVTGGSKFTVEEANRLKKPVLVIDSFTPASEIRLWLKTNNIKVLNGAGNRESKIGDTSRAQQTLKEIFNPAQTKQAEGVPVTSNFVYGMVLEDPTSGIYKLADGTELSFTNINKTFFMQEKSINILNTAQKLIYLGDQGGITFQNATETNAKRLGFDNLQHFEDSSQYIGDMTLRRISRLMDHFADSNYISFFPDGTYDPANVDLLTGETVNRTSNLGQGSQVRRNPTVLVDQQINLAHETVLKNPALKKKYLDKKDKWKGKIVEQGLPNKGYKGARDQFSVPISFLTYWKNEIQNNKNVDENRSFIRYVEQTIDSVAFPLMQLSAIMDIAAKYAQQTDQDPTIINEPLNVWLEDVVGVQDALKDPDISDQGKAYAENLDTLIAGVGDKAGKNLDKIKGEVEVFSSMAEQEEILFRGRGGRYSPGLAKPIFRDAEGKPILDKDGNVQLLEEAQRKQLLKEFVNYEIDETLEQQEIEDSFFGVPSNMTVEDAKKLVFEPLEMEQAKGGKIDSTYITAKRNFVPPRKLEMPKKTVPKNPKPKTIVAPKMEQELNNIEDSPLPDNVLYQQFTAPDADPTQEQPAPDTPAPTTPETQEEAPFQGLPDAETMAEMTPEEQQAAFEAGYRDFNQEREAEFEAKEPTPKKQTKARKKVEAKKEAKRKAAKAKAFKLRQENLKKKRKEQEARLKAANQMRITITERIMQAARRLGLQRDVQIIHIDEQIGSAAEGNFSLGSGGANAKLQKAIDDLKARIDRGERKFGRNVRFKNGDVIIIAPNTTVVGKAKGYYTTLMHEIGESFVNQEIDRSLKNPRIRKKLLEAFNKVKDKTPAYQTENGFYEFVADNFGAAIRRELGITSDLYSETLNKMNKSAQGWFTRLAKQLVGFYNALPDALKIRMEANETVQEYIDEIAKGIRFPISNAKLSYETKAKIEEELDLLMGPETYTEKHLRKIVLKGQKLLRSDKLPNWLQKIFFTGDSRLRNLGPVGVEIANFYYSQSRTKTKTGLLLAKQAKAQGYISKIADILEVTDNFNVLQPNFYSTLTEAQNEILRAAESDVATADLQNPKAVELRNFLKEMYEELGLKELGVKERANFFPRVIAIYEIAGNEKIRQDLINLLDAKNPKVPRVEIIQAVDKLVAKGQGHIDFDKKKNDPLEVGVLYRYKPIFENVTRTELRNINAIESPEVALKKYIDKAVMRHEFEKRGGVEYLRSLMDQLTPEQQIIAQEVQDGIMGRVSPIQNGMLRWANNVGLVLNIVTLLAFTVLASLPDLAGPILRSRSADVRPIFNTIKYMIKNPQEARELSKEIGVIGVDAMSTFFINAGEVDFLSQTGQKVSNTFFRVTGLEYFTRFTRVFATGMGKQFMINHAKKAKAGDLTSQSYLEELQVTADEVLLWEQGKASPEVRAKVNEGLARFVDESIVRPNSAERPTWANDPRYALIWQLKSFYYAYGKTIVGGAMRDAKGNAKNGGISAAAMPLVFMALMLLPLTILGWEIREFTKAGLAWLLPGVSPNDPGVDYYRTDSMTNGQYYTELIDRTGMLGPASMALPMFLESHRHGKPFWISPLGPAAERIYDARPWDFDMKPADFIPVYSQLDTRAFGDAARQ